MVRRTPVARELTFAFPGDINTLTGGYLYDKQIIGGLRELGWDVQALSLDASFPWPSEAVRRSSANALSSVQASSLLVVDGLALGALGAQASAIASARPYVALVHHPLALESGLSPDQAESLFLSEYEALRYADQVIVTSPTTATTVQEQFHVPRDKIHVVLPGIDRGPMKPIPRSADEPLRLLSVGAIVPRKAFDVLISALAQVKALPWRLTIVGDDTRAPETSAQLRCLIQTSGLSDRVKLTGSVQPEELSARYADADAFVSASRYEGYGMALAEALAWGLPIIATTGGAVVQTVPPQTGLLVAPDSPEILAQAIQRLLVDDEKRNAMATAAREHADSLPSWNQSARRFAAALTSGHTQ
jgi:glycosyltransferase involved in cell wall biosynthesis